MFTKTTFALALVLATASGASVLSALRVLWAWVPSSARAHDRTGRRARQRWQPLDLIQVQLPAARARALQTVPAVDAGEAPRCASSRRVEVLRRPCPLG